MNGEEALEYDLDLSRIGDIFGVCHDLYKSIYDAHTEEDPTIWGHPMDHLVFERLFFSPREDLADEIWGEFRFGLGS